MDICPICKSDDVEKTYSIGLRVLVCVILLFVPFGIFFCWIPFVFPYRHVCHVCGTDLSSDQLLRMDWREKEELLKEHQHLEEMVSPFLGKWVKDQEEGIFKVAKGKGQIFLVEIQGVRKVTTYRVVAYNEQNNVPEIKVSPKVGAKFRHVIKEAGDFISFDDETEYTNEPSLTELGKELLTEDEFNHIIDSDLDIDDWLKNLCMDQQKIKIDILAE
ncbi:LITAF-like zinc ribbon domain-containing protein [Aquibacillus sediminis]|uniref:LITAF-like zinc ribbon domain-containing protein n=1 Tax=Aquibacillus sediminis TaxID=2574734 RepID=UPI0011089583|nr:LITAF-like zinc ribbon domain-containing protein [Aquibacillus sediminis]